VEEMTFVDAGREILGSIRVARTARQDAKKVGKEECGAYMD